VTFIDHVSFLIMQLRDVTTAFTFNGAISETLMAILVAATSHLPKAKTIMSVLRWQTSCHPGHRRRCITGRPATPMTRTRAAIQSYAEDAAKVVQKSRLS
jgi:hypothetical protein